MDRPIDLLPPLSRACPSFEGVLGDYRAGPRIVSGPIAEFDLLAEHLVQCWEQGERRELPATLGVATRLHATLPQWQADFLLDQFFGRLLECWLAAGYAENALVAVGPEGLQGTLEMVRDFRRRRYSRRSPLNE